MLRLKGSLDYYPTPDTLLNRITAGLDWEKVEYVLEPSAGKGNIAEYVKREIDNRCRYGWGDRRRPDIDCVEIEPELRSILIGKGFRVIHDDFLTLHTYKHYDLVIMNPPFSNGAGHLLKALEVQSVSGGAIICILNAETIRNLCTNERNLLWRKLSGLGAQIEFIEGAFSKAENPTDVEIAVVKVTVPEPERHSVLFDTLREKKYEELKRDREFQELAPADIVEAYVAQYNREIEWGLRLWDEFLELKAGAMDETTTLDIGINERGHGSTDDFTINRYVRSIRRKYWDKFFKSPNITRRMTSNLQNEYLSQVNEFVNYDFSYWNVKTVMIDITKNLTKGVEDCIIELFDELSAVHAWEPGTKNNIHYYDGWATNKSWYVNRKVILTCIHAFSDYDGRLEIDYRVRQKLADIEKALNYLDSGETEGHDLYLWLEEAAKTQQSRNIRLKYFNVTFYKKGTCHLEFTNERLLKKLNIFGSQRKGWLPSGYGRKHYKDMTREEQHVIDSFEGPMEYEQTVSEAQYYLFDAARAIPALHE